MFYEIKGLEDGKCILYLKVKNRSIEFSTLMKERLLNSGFTEEQIQKQEEDANKEAQLLVGKDGTCRFNNNTDLTYFLNKWKEGTFSGSDWAVADCEGKMFTATQ